MLKVTGLFNTLRQSQLRNHITTHYLAKDRLNDIKWKNVDLARDRILVDVVVVGGGPAGLSSAIRLAQLSKQHGNKLKICVIEKSSNFGGHILSGACFDPSALNELIPDWKLMKNHPIDTRVTENKINYLTNNWCINIPLLEGSPLSNHGNYIIRLGNLVGWLSGIAEELGVELFCGVGANEILYDNYGSVIGIGIADTGVCRDGTPKENFLRGPAIYSKITVLAEGCHGSLSKEIIKKFNLRKNICPPSYSLGFKELWSIESSKHAPGSVEHNVGFPLDKNMYGGSFVYHLNEKPLISIGLIIGLNYSNTYINPYKEFQLLKTHPKFRNLLKNGERIGYGARTLNEGGFQTIPKLIFPGGCLVGCSAGFLNAAKLKGIHTAMKSGMIAAEAIYESIMLSNNSTNSGIMLENYVNKLKESWLYNELKSTRNIRPSINTTFGLYGMMLYSGVVWPLTKGYEPITFKWKKYDHQYLLPANQCKKKIYPKPDNIFTYDLMTSIELTNTSHNNNQPSHLILYDDNVPEEINHKIYDGPEERYCPAGVYEYVENPENLSQKILCINSQNCIHCKACDIKDPKQNIHWVVPENNSGPNYIGL